MNEQFLPHGSRLISIPSVTDARGTLTFATALREVPFDIERVFWIHGVPKGQSRGGHAHNVCSEVVVPVAGAFTMILDDGRARASVRMQRPDQGILVPAGMWCELTDFQPGTVLAVMASHPYDAAGYINDYEQYKQTTLK